MSPFICYLITVLYDERLLKCALKIHHEKVPAEIREYYNQDKGRAFLLSKLPAHVQRLGPIVKVEEIFEITV